MGIFDLDGPLMRFLGRMADIMWLNILTLICCIPVVTAGAAITAMHYVSLKMVRNEEGYITKDFFRSFKLNFRQSTILWLILLLFAVLLGGDYYILSRGEIQIGKFIRAAIIAVTILVAFTAVMVFPLLARFTNSVKNTIKNGFSVAVLQLPKTFLMVILVIVPFVVAGLFWQAFPVVFLFGLALPAYLSAMLYNKTFKMLEERFLEATAGERGDEEKEENPEEEDERIFKDELDEALITEEERKNP